MLEDYLYTDYGSSIAQAAGSVSSLLDPIMACLSIEHEPPFPPHYLY